MIFFAIAHWPWLWLLLGFLLGVSLSALVIIWHSLQQKQMKLDSPESLKPENALSNQVYPREDVVETPPKQSSPEPSPSVAASPLAGTEAEGAGWMPSAHNPAADLTANPLFATLSHELRTPLNGILGMTQILRSERDDERIHSIDAATRHILILLENFINLEKLRDSQVAEQREWLYPLEIFEEVRQSLRFRARSRGLRIQLETRAAARLRYDRTWLKTIVENIVLASLEDTGPDDLETPMTITWGMMPLGGEKVIAINIENPRESWRTEDKDNKFTPLGAIAGQYYRRATIDGLLRAVAKNLVERSNGEIIVENGSTGGKIYRILIRSAEIMPTTTGMTRSPFATLSLERKDPLAETGGALKILIVEDDVLNQKVLTYMLSRMGHTTEIANNGEEAIAKLKVAQFDLVLMDIDMPVRDGISTTAGIRSGEAGESNSSIMISAVTAFATTSDQSRFIKGGMDYFVAKPVSSEKLRPVLIAAGKKKQSQSVSA